MPAATAVGASLCVVETNPANYVSTGASAGSTQLPSGSSVSVGGTAYTYTRTGTDRIAFTWTGTATSALNFGDVGLNGYTDTGTMPSGFTACAKTTPANPAPAPSVSCASAQAAGGTGAIDWKFTGVLNPGDTGTVLFTVKVD